jgi:hypothetical protein
VLPATFDIERASIAARIVGWYPIPRALSRS